VRSNHHRSRMIRTSILVGVIVLSGTTAVYLAHQDQARSDITVIAAHEGATVPTSPDYTFERLPDPGRTLVRAASGALVATFTDDARTVAIQGPARTFTEPQHTTASVTTTVWVRLAPQPWRAGAENDEWFRPWLDKVAGDESADILAFAADYIIDAPDERNEQDVRYVGDATFGPDSAEGKLEASDFYDYLGVSWSFPDGVEESATPKRYGSVDCSGYVRLVYGYRAGYPLRGSNTAGEGLPRRAWAMSELGPGAQIIADTGQRATGYTRLQPGDLVFFNLDPHDGPQIDHSGIYLGLDSDGHHRIVSSREMANGPTLGDYGGKSLLDQNGFYSKAFRAAKRL
jgi:cell wall-associated NlpC family hydrolase